MAGTPATLRAEEATAQGQASATVVRPLTTRALEDLSFGAITVGQSAGGEVLVAPGGEATRYSGTVRQACGQGADCASHPARFAVTGEAGRSYSVVLPTGVQARGTRTGTLLHLSALTLATRNPGAPAGGGQLDAAGEDSFAVGGVLQVPAATRPDTFRADLPVTVNYN